MAASWDFYSCIPLYRYLLNLSFVFASIWIKLEEGSTSVHNPTLWDVRIWLVGIGWTEVVTSCVILLDSAPETKCRLLFSGTYPFSLSFQRVLCWNSCNIKQRVKISVTLWQDIATEKLSIIICKSSDHGDVGKESTDFSDSCCRKTHGS